MSLCKFFEDPAQARTCRAGVSYLKLAGGGVHQMVLRLPCIPLPNRAEPKRCPQYQPDGEENGTRTNEQR